jgi:hypothetical protein
MISPHVVDRVAAPLKGMIERDVSGDYRKPYFGYT